MAAASRAEKDTAPAPPATEAPAVFPRCALCPEHPMPGTMRGSRELGEYEGPKLYNTFFYYRIACRTQSMSINTFTCHL